MFKIFYFFTALIVFLFKPEKYSIFSYDYNFFISLIYFSLISVFLLEQRLRDKNWLRFDLIFLIGYSIVHFQIPFLASIGIEPSRPYFVWLNKDVVNYATWMSTVAISLWILGYSLLSGKKAIYSNQSESFIINYRLLDNLLLVFFVGFLITVGRSFLTGAYNVESWGVGATYFLLLLEILIYLRILYFFRDLPKESSYNYIFKKILLNRIFFIILIAYTLLFFLSGSRGELIRILLIIAFAYSIYIKSISFKFILVSILIGSFILTLMGLGRSRDTVDFGNQSLLERGYTNYKDTDKQSNFTEELATSIRIQYRAIDIVPYSYPYMYGYTYIGTLSGVIPFASSFIINFLNIPDCYKGSASFFTCVGQGNNITYGEGSEILADLYINFGLYGTFFIMFWFGCLVSKINNNIKKKKFTYILIYSILLITALAMSRGTVLYAYKDIVYILFFHFLFSGKFKLAK